jgi:hypothetical protein
MNVLPVRFLRITDPVTFVPTHISVDWIAVIYEDALGVAQVATQHGVFPAAGSWEDLIAAADLLRSTLTPSDRVIRSAFLQFPQDTGRMAPFDPTAVQAVAGIDGFPSYSLVWLGGVAPLQVNLSPDEVTALLRTTSD